MAFIFDFGTDVAPPCAHCKSTLALYDPSSLVFSIVVKCVTCGASTEILKPHYMEGIPREKLTTQEVREAHEIAHGRAKVQGGANGNA